jgi:hypothetical protein
MKHFICVLKSTTNDKPIEMRLITAASNIGSIEIAPYNFTDEKSARAYLVQLEQHAGIFNTTQQRSPDKKRKSVKNVSSGQIFPSASAAAKSVGVSTSYMTHQLRKHQGATNIKGLVFAWLDVATARGF